MVHRDQARKSDDRFMLGQCLSEHKATLQRLLASISDGLIIVDSEGRIGYWNQQTEHLLDQPPYLQVGTPVIETLTALAQQTMDANQALIKLEHAMRHLSSFPQKDLDLIRPKLVTLRLQFFPSYDAEQALVSYGIILRDVTEQTSMEKLKAQLLATVAHELRAPLASIKGFATTLLREDVAWDPESQHEFIEIIDEESDRLTTLVDDLFDTSRFVLGHYPLDKEPVDLAKLIHKVAKQAQARTAIHRITTQLPDQETIVQADAHRIQQVLHNLMDNAIKYSPKGGDIILDIAAEPSQFVISISDQGIGIPMEEQPLIFELFYRGKSLEPSEQVGLGLGLSICRGIIEAHGGTIWVNSQRGHGSTFYFTLPNPDPSAA